MKKTLLVISMLVASTALAHEGVKNPAVKARMDSMSAIAENMKSLSLMLKGDEAFDLDNAQLSLSKIADHAAQTPALFEAQMLLHHRIVQWLPILFSWSTCVALAFTFETTT